MISASRAARQSGFTLLEMLVALTVLGFLIVGLASGVRTGLMFWDAQARRVAETADLDAAARTLRRLLTDIPVKPATDAAAAAPSAIMIKGDSRGLAFVGDLPDGFGATRRADITIELRQRRVVLAWRPHLHAKALGPPAAISRIVLVADVERLEFAYWGQPKAEDAPAWLSGWDGPALPRLIRVRLGFGKMDTRHWPDLIAAPRLYR